VTPRPVLTLCHACRSPLSDAINKRLKAGEPDVRVSKWLEEQGHYLSRLAIGKHRREHLTDEFQAQVKAAKKELERNKKTIKGDGDLAKLVRDVAMAAVEAGELRPTLQEGLRAQEILDRRVEKSADRDLTLILAQVLGGGQAYGAPLLTDGAVEGEYEVVGEA